MRQSYEPGERITCDMPFVINAIADAPEGYMIGTASTASVDLHGHRVLSGAFDQSIKAKGLHGPRGIKLLAFHDWSKPAGVIKRLETVHDRLRIEAQLNTNVSYIKDLHTVAKDNGGLNFSVGFSLKKDGFEFQSEEDEEKDGCWVVIKDADLMEVSVVAFPAQPEATMDFIKHADTPSEFEKALMASGLAMTRNEANKLMKLCKRNIHLFDAPMLVPSKPPDHPVPDVQQLSACVDLMRKTQAILGRR